MIVKCRFQGQDKCIINAIIIKNPRNGYRQTFRGDNIEVKLFKLVADLIT